MCCATEEIPGYVPIKFGKEQTGIFCAEGRMSAKHRRNVSSAPLHVMFHCRWVVPINKKNQTKLQNVLFKNFSYAPLKMTDI